MKTGRCLRARVSCACLLHHSSHASGSVPLCIESREGALDIFLTLQNFSSLWYCTKASLVIAKTRSFDSFVQQRRDAAFRGSPAGHGNFGGLQGR